MQDALAHGLAVRKTTRSRKDQLITRTRRVVRVRSRPTRSRGPSAREVSQLWLTLDSSRMPERLQASALRFPSVNHGPFGQVALRRLLSANRLLRLQLYLRGLVLCTMMRVASNMHIEELGGHRMGSWGGRGGS